MSALKDPRTAPAIVLHAGSLAQALGSRLVLVHAQPNLPPPLRPHAVLPDARLALGAAAAEIVRVGHREDAEVIVVGSRGSDGLGGSALRRVIADAPCPVLVVPQAANRARTLGADARQATIVCGVDRSGPTGPGALVAADLAARLHARLVLVHAYGPGGTTYDDPISTAEALQWTEPSPGEEAAANLLWDTLEVTGGEAVMGAGPAPAVFQQVASARNADLIVVGAGHRSRIFELLFGSVSRTVARSATRPVLVVPEHLELTPGSGHYELGS